MTGTDTGPHLLACVLCEKVIEDKEGVLSLIRIVDQITHSAIGPEPPEDMPPFILDHLKLVLMLKAGKAKGRFKVKIRPEDPSGVQLPVVETTVQLEGGHGGVNIIAPLAVPIAMEGLYWFDVFFAAGKGDKTADRLLTRLPLKIEYQPQKTPGS